VHRIKADAIGEPGHRRFSLLVESPGGAATLWLEKDQLYSLALAIQQILVTERASRRPEARPSLLYGDPPLTSAQVEIEVGSLALVHDPASDRFGVLVYERTEERDVSQELPPALRCWASREQIKAFSEEALAVCAAGRPLCPLCHGPMGPEAHICPKHNGHVVA